MRERDAVLFISEWEARNYTRNAFQKNAEAETEPQQQGGRAGAQCPRAEGGWGDTRGDFMKAPERRPNTASRSQTPLFTQKSLFTREVEAGLKVSNKRMTVVIATAREHEASRVLRCEPKVRSHHGRGARTVRCGPAPFLTLPPR